MLKKIILSLLLFVSLTFIYTWYNGYYKKTFTLDFDPSKKVQNFEFELNVRRDQDKDKYHTIFLLMYFDDLNDRSKFMDKNCIYHHHDNIFRRFDNVKIKTILKDNYNDVIVKKKFGGMYCRAIGVDNLIFDLQFWVHGIQKGKYKLSMEITQLGYIDYSKVSKMEIDFTRPSNK